ncbi:FtsX-like permease family protein [Vitiosangium sp. GDMCC 1.1324]|uniref:ABC transporter permease n=1 Tax=Vitiosangium sp. (strain GDMCC 1.1324) TaxID=2138576 RepID=UPI000D33EA6B|nr:FtsX-like permease family protein [Vitiosangium sp. GDMCC 1.1324]PTL78718.1 ABC transporter permease [Vitiosangium sp. GDMCC 1.1324]
MLQLLLIAVRNLGTHRRRTLMLGGAIAGVTALLVTLMGVSNGMRETLLESATTLMTGHVNVAGFYKVTSGRSAPVVSDYPKLLEQLKQEVPELDYSVQRGRGWARLISETSSLQASVGGIDVTKEEGFRKVVQVREGHLEDLAQPNTLLLFEEQARQLEVKVGDTLTLSAPTMRGTSNTVDVRLVAIAANVGMLSSFTVFVSDATLRSLYQLRADATGAVQLYLKDRDAVPEVQARLRERLAALGYRLMDSNPQPFFMKFDTVNREPWVGQKLDITTWEGEVSFLNWSLSTMDTLTWGLTSVLLLIIAVGTMNTVWISIRERTREVGTLRAIGMQRGWVSLMFLFEVFSLALLATLAGAAVGLGMCLATNAAHPAVPASMQSFLMSDTLHLVVRPGAVAGAIAIITLCTTAVSLIPSLRAAKLEPITAMQHVS